jgi:hypothetical protein
MQIAFVETMRGFVTPKSGPSAPVDFNVRASGGAGGHFTLTGVVHAGPWIDETTCEGTLDISALPPRLAYDVHFKTADGQRLRLHGAKHPSVLSPVSSMTVLPIELSDAQGVVLGEGELRFDLTELPGFIASWLPRPSRAHRQLEARRVAVARLQLTGEP